MTVPSLHFDYDEFVSLSDEKLVEYADPLANTAELSISKEDLEQLRKHLDDYDEYHLVYALEIGTDNFPETFSPEVPRFLANQMISVYCAADRVLRRLDARFITPKLLLQIENVFDDANDERKSFLQNLLTDLKDKADA